MEKEIWLPINGYIGLYEVSNLGRVKSLERTIFRKNKSKYRVKELILNPTTVSLNYKVVTLWNNGVAYRWLVHRLVGIAFIPNPNNYLQINHKDFNPSNNNVKNLEWVSNRMNNTHKVLSMEKSSKYVGVNWCKIRKKWKASIRVNGKKISIGRFSNEIDAHIAYQEKLFKHLKAGFL